MSDRMIHALTITSVLGSGIVAGVFFAFSSFVMAALARLPANQGIAAMQSINITVINPLFMLILFGTGLLGAALAVGVYLAWPQPRGLLLVAGAVVYIVGVLGVTMAGNVPLNAALAAANPQSAEASWWAGYLADWTTWNHVRTIASALSMLLFLLAL
ncbi:DUF1772 domain-containing protein [Rhizobium sp. TH2]|uniref:anthrone oxygenase family protein n=1 Tax=Rhizobium sp. TH2 TaxID=2775403 RepID=UPI002157A3BF|nr:anthrone oxygenase family protein [Rhizobium sp. TH2]UVC10667.1 DUF1772 domain-containing protein [Rhizobium sp. TH2]